ncbi:hypothetical protein D9M68_745700 [compost metagenome]
MADEETGTRYRVQDVATAGARTGGCRVAIERQVAKQYLGTGTDLCAIQVGQAGGIAGDGRRTLRPGGGAGIGQAGVVRGDLVEHEAACQALLAAAERQ